jgi:hypothetical protein
MAGNNSCGSRSIAYGNMVHNVLAIEALTATGERWKFGPMNAASGPPATWSLVARLRALYERERDEIAARFPKVLRKGRRIQPGSPGAAARQRRAPSGRLGRHARLVRTVASEAFRRCRRRARSACAISRSSTRRWKARSTSFGSVRRR